MSAATRDEVTNINNILKKLSNSIRWTSAYAPFIWCKIGDLEFATSNIDSKSNYLLSLTHEKTGCGKANSFTLNIAYYPDPLDASSIDEKGKLETLDVELIGSKIEFRYGYRFPDWVTYDIETHTADISGISILDSLESETYTGTIYDYSIEITNSMINYRITGVSEIAILKDVILEKTAEELKQLAGDTYNPIKLVKGLLEEQIDNFGLDYVVVDCVNGDYSNEDIKNGVPENFCGCVDNKDLFTDISNEPLFDFINSTILPSARALNPDQSAINITTETEADSEDGGKENSKDDEQTEPVDLITFTYTFHDHLVRKDRKRVITLDYVNPNEKFTSDQVVDFGFNWMSGKLTDIVLNFTPNFQGSIAIANAASLKNTIKDMAKNDNIAITGDGVMEVLTSYVNQRVKGNSGDESIMNILTAIADMAIFQQSPYTASLSTLGIPYDIPMLTHINVKPSIYGRLHYTAGEYRITKITDQISSGGFNTEFELIRIATGDMSERITEIIQSAGKKK